MLWFGKYAFPIYLFEGGILYRRYEIFYMTDTAFMTNIEFYLYSIGMAYLFWNYVLIPVRSKIDRAVGFTGSDRPAQLEEEHGKETDTAV